MSEAKANWLVKLRVTKTSYVVCHNCTEEEARRIPYTFAVDEQDEDLSDWEVLSVKENK